MLNPEARFGWSLAIAKSQLLVERQFPRCIGTLLE